MSEPIDTDIIFIDRRKTNDMELDVIRARKAKEYQIQSYQRDMNFKPDVFMKSKINDFSTNFLPHHEYDQTKDFANYFLPSEDVFSATGSGADLTWGFSEFRYLAEKRIGLGKRITRDVANDASRDRFKFLNIKSNKVEELPKILNWLDDTNFFEAFAEVVYYERVYGVGFLVKIFTDNDREKEKLGESPYTKDKNRMPIAWKAYPPTLMYPMGIVDSSALDEDPQKWDVGGGGSIQSATKIHRDRVHVFRSRPVEHRWWGLSIFEPIWYPIVCYFMAQIFTLRAFSRLGSSILSVGMDEELGYDALYNKYENLVEEMKMNGTLIFKKGTDINVIETKIASGLKELLDIWIEDISSGTGIPVSILMGRSEAAGMGGQMYLVFERYYWNMISKIQHAFTNDVEDIIEAAGFDLSKHKIDWVMGMVKTDAQRLADEAMELQNEGLEIANKNAKTQGKMMEIELQVGELEVMGMEENLINGALEPLGGSDIDPKTGASEPKTKPKPTTESKTGDFVEELRQERAKKLLNYYKGRKY